MSVGAQDRSSTQPTRAGTAYSSRVRSGVDAAPEAGDNYGLASIRGGLTLLLPNVRAGLVAPASCTVVGELLSLHVWGKNLRAGMPTVLPTTTEPTMTERRRKSRDREFDL
jgi:hypothetical protein